MANEALRDFLEASRSKRVVYGYERLKLDRRVLEDLGRASFRCIERLIFAEDVGPEVFEACVEEVVNCRVVVVPDEVYSAALLKCSRVGRLYKLSEAIRAGLEELWDESELARIANLDRIVLTKEALEEVLSRGRRLVLVNCDEVVMAEDVAPEEAEAILNIVNCDELVAPTRVYVNIASRCVDVGEVRLT